MKCGEQSSYADEARLTKSDVDSTSMMGAYRDNERSYLALVSDVPLDIARVADAHRSGFDAQDELANHHCLALDLPSAIATENAAFLYKASNPDNPDWTDGVSSTATPLSSDAPLLS